MYYDDKKLEFIEIKTPEEIERIRIASKLAAETLVHVSTFIKPGVTTALLDRIANEFIVKKGGYPSSLGYKGYPASICTSVNDVVCHGIPSDIVTLNDGDIINVDIAVFKDGFHGDTSMTFPVGNASSEALRLINVTKCALAAGIASVKSGARTRDIGAAIEACVQGTGFSIVRDFVGHGIGRGYHEPPSILHYKNTEAAVRFRPGMVFTIEPMLNVGSPDVTIDDDGWTARTIDKKLSAQFEHTIVVTEQGAEILTRL